MPIPANQSASKQNAGNVSNNASSSAHPQVIKFTVPIYTKPNSIHRAEQRERAAYQPNYQQNAHKYVHLEYDNSTPKHQDSEIVDGAKANNNSLVSSATQSPFLGDWDSYDYLMKCLIIGDSGTGKSALLRRYIRRDFLDHHSATIGVDFEVRTMKCDDKTVKMQMWDTAGQERFRTITNAYFKGAAAVIIVFDVTDEDSFQSVKRWVNEVHHHRRSASEQAEPPVMLLVANKVDMVSKRVVEPHRIEQLATELGDIPWIETSAKTNHNVDSAFHTIALEFVKERRFAGDLGIKHKPDMDKPSVDINNGNSSSSIFSCCRTQ